MEDPDVNVEVEDDFQQEPANTGPNVLLNQTPNMMIQSYQTVVQFLSAYGWFIVVGLIAIFFIKSKLDPYIYNMMKKREEQQEYTTYDPETTRARQEAMETARMRLQEKHAADAERHAEKQKQKEEEKRKQKIEEWEKHKKGAGYRSKYRPAEEQDPSSSGSRPGSSGPRYRPSDYNPLTGSGGGGTGYRPSRAGGGGGG